MPRLTNQSVMDKINVIEKKLPNGELEKIRSNTEKIKNHLQKVTEIW